MLKEYSISDILGLPPQHISYFVGTFEGTDDADIEWPHRHNFYSLIWFTEGSGFYVIDMQEFEIIPNRIFQVSPKQIHNWDYAENSKGYILVCDASLALTLNLGYSSPYIDIGDKASLLKEIFTNLLTETKKNDNLACRNVESGISYLYAILERLSADKKIKSQGLDKTLERLKHVVYEDFHQTKVERYAEMIGFSADILNPVCKQITGITLKQFILDLKVTEAKRLLIYSDKNINEIAYSLGFDDSSYFSRIFKKKTSFTPLGFIKKYRKL